jgi:hypothetical protein
MAFASTLRPMTDDRMSGLALIAASCGMIITMTLHPSGHIAAAELEPMIRRLIAVHALALACVPVLFLGAWGLSRRIASSDRMAMTGLVAYTFALVAITSAAVADGLVTPNVLRQIVASAGSQPAIDAWRMISHYNLYINQAYAQVFVVASSAAILLWSISVWRSGKLAPGLAVYGFLLGPITLMGLFSGHLNLDKHGFGIVALGQAAWFIAAGVLLWSQQTRATAASG